MVIQPLLLLKASDLQVFLDPPEQLLQQSVKLQLAVASFVDTPRSLLDILVNSPDGVVAEAARLHVNYAGEVDNSLEFVAEILLSRQMGQNNSLAVELLKVGTVPPCFLSGVPAENLIQALKNSQMPLRYRLQLLELVQKSIEARLQIAESPETPIAMLEQLAGDLELPVRLAVKFNPNCPPTLIELVEEQQAIASDGTSNREQLEVLGQSRWTWIRLAIAQNPNTPQATLMELARNSVLKIQLAVAKNPATSTEVLALLAEHEDTRIQAALAEHGNITEEIMHQLFPTQQGVLQKRENLPISILERFCNERATDKLLWKDYGLRDFLLSHANTPTWILAELANVDLQALKAEKQATHQSAAILDKSIQDDIRFLADIAQHPQVSAEILIKLVHYSNIFIKLAVAQNAQTPDNVRVQLLEKLILSKEKRIIQKIASNPNTPVSILEKIGEQESQQNKFLIKLRQLLTRDPQADKYAVDSCLDETDICMSKVRKNLNQYQANINVEEWMTLIEIYQWMTLLENYNYFGDLQRRYHKDADFQEMVNEQWQQLLPSLPDSALREVIDNILKISDFLLVEVVQSDRKISVALVGNPSIPVTLREELQITLTKSVYRRGSHTDDSDMRMALAYNTQLPEVERLRYFQNLIVENRNYYNESIASNPLTPPSILKQLLERGQQEGIAKNPAVPEYLLRKIVDSSQPYDYILRTIAENPHTPADLLMRIARHPQEKKAISNISIYNYDLVIANPNLPAIDRYRLILEKEEYQETVEAHELLIRRSNTPYALTQVIKKGDRKAKIIAACSQETSIYLLEMLAKDTDETIRSLVVENPKLPASSLLELIQDPRINIRVSLARHRQNKQILEKLVNDESPIVREQVAANPDTPVELLRKLSFDTDKNVWNALARNQNTPVDVLEFLGVEKGVVHIYNAKTPGSALEKAVENALKTGFRFRDKALNELLQAVPGSQMPGFVLAKLANYQTSWIRLSVANHPNTPISALELLLNDDYSPVLWAIARRTDTPPHFLERLLQGKDKNSQDYEQICLAICDRQDIALTQLANDEVEVRREVAQNPNTPSSICESLPDLIVQPTEQQTISPTLHGLSRSYNPSTDDLPTILTEYSQSENDFVRFVTLTNPQTPVEILSQAAHSASWLERYAVADNPAISREIRLSLTQDSNCIVRSAAKATLLIP